LIQPTSVGFFISDAFDQCSIAATRERRHHN